MKAEQEARLLKKIFAAAHRAECVNMGDGIPTGKTFAARSGTVDGLRGAAECFCLSDDEYEHFLCLADVVEEIAMRAAQNGVEGLRRIEAAARAAVAEAYEEVDGIWKEGAKA